MNRFDETQPGYLYFIENHTAKMKKVGITNNLAGINARYGSSWKLNTFVFSEDGRVVKRAEQVVLQSIRKDQDTHKPQSKAFLKKGYTETFSDKMTNNKVLRLITRSFRQSCQIYKPELMFVTYKLYNKNNGKLRSLRPVNTKRRPRATEERKLTRWLMPI